MSDIPADDAPEPADDDDAGIDADVFSPVIDPDFVTGQRPMDDTGAGGGEPGEQDPEKGDT
ncbi:hypothetical protein AB6813_00165 [bacterium RCC_150]